MTVFIDSNYFIALGNSKDYLHEHALILSDKLLEERATLVLSNLVFAEVTTVLSQRTSREIAITFGNELLQNRQNEIIYLTEKLQQKSWEIFQKAERKNVSFVDCSTLAIMEFENIPTLLSFDKTDFKPLQKLY